VITKADIASTVVARPNPCLQSTFCRVMITPFVKASVGATA